MSPASNTPSGEIMPDMKRVIKRQHVQDKAEPGVRVRVISGGREDAL